MIPAANDYRDVTRQKALRFCRVIEPQPRVTTQHRVQRELYGPGQRQAPRGSGDRASEYGARRMSPGEAIMQYVHHLTVSHWNMNVIHIDPLYSEPYVR
jgi:hypothetical protein